MRVHTYISLTTCRKAARAEWVLGNLRSSRESSEDRSPPSLSHDTSPLFRLRRKPNISNLRSSVKSSLSRQSSDSSQYSGYAVPVTVIWKPTTANSSRNGSVEQPEPLIIEKSVSFKLLGPQTTRSTARGGSPRTGAEWAAGAAYRKYGKPTLPFNPTASRTSRLWRPASRKTAFTGRRQGILRSRFFPASATSLIPTRSRYPRWFRQFTAVASKQTDTQQGSTTKAETFKAAPGQRRERTGYIEAGTMRGRQGQEGRYLRAKTLRKGSRRQFWR